MKKLQFLFLVIGLMVFGTTNAQTPTTLPDWGVADSNNATYYYLPDIETYYDIRNRTFVHQDNGKWVKSAELPAAYRDYDLYNGYKVVLTEDREPYADFDQMRTRYAKGYKGDKQRTVKIKDDKIKIKEK